MDIRTARFDDITDLVEFNQAMAMETESKQLDPEVLMSGVRSVLEDPGRGCYYVAEENGLIAGGLLVTFEWSDWRNKWFWWIQSVYVRPEFRGRSIYRSLYEFVKDAARQNSDVAGYRLYVERDNRNARNVYEHLGMTESHYVMYEEETI